MITRKKKAKLLNYCTTYIRNINENTDKDIFNIKRKTLEDIMNLTIELLFEFNSTKINCNNYRQYYINEHQSYIGIRKCLNDSIYKEEVLRKYFYKFNRIKDYVKRREIEYNNSKNKEVINNIHYIKLIDDINVIIEGE